MNVIETLGYGRFSPSDNWTKAYNPSPMKIEAERIKALALPPHSPNLNAFAERWARSVKEECLSKLILFGERSMHYYEIHCPWNEITKAKIIYCFFLCRAN
jgi:hypothetical protein